MRLFRRSRDRELDEELQAHLRMAEAERIASGETPSEAAANARRELGNYARVKEETRAAWGGVALERFGQDLRHGARMFRRNPGVSLLAVLCLTVGIGSNAAVFGWIEGILVRPFRGVEDQERLFAIVGTRAGEPGFDDLSWPDFADLRRNCRLIDAFIADKIMGATLSLGNRAEFATGSVVSANYFDALGARPSLGRGFLPAEEVGDRAHPVAVVSWREWQERFRGDPAVVGKTQRLNGVPHTIVGVGPKGFDGTFVGYTMRYFVPASMDAAFEAGGYKLEDRSARWIEGFVRLKPGVTMGQAQGELSAVARRLEAEFPETNRGRGVRIYPLPLTPFNKASEVRPVLRIMVLVSAFVLVVACANVGNLLLVRAFSRRHEMTVRLAIGAGRRRLAAQLVTEGLVLAAAGIAGGLLFAYLFRRALVVFFSSQVSLSGSLDGRVLALSAAVCLAATIGIGLAPALQTRRLDAATVLRSEAGSVVGGTRGWLRSALVLLQLSLSFVLLVGAGLVVRSLRKIQAASPGFSADDVTMTPVDLSDAGDPDRASNAQQAILERVAADPRVRSVAIARFLPLGYRPPSNAPIGVDGYVPRPDELPTAEYDEVSPSYFATLGIPLAEGRGFGNADDARGAPVAIVNEAMVRRYWGGKSPLGSRLVVRGRPMTVIGVAKTSTYHRMGEEPLPFFYVPLLQNPESQTVVFVRSPAPAGEIAKTVGREISAVDPDVAPGTTMTLRQVIDRAAAPQRIAVKLLEVFGGLALALAAIGLFGVMSYAVSQRGREMGVRIALGARSSDLQRLVLSHGVGLALAGTAIGGAAALSLTRLLQNLLYGVGPRDPGVFAGTSLVLLVFAFAACALPAWRAARIDPWKALREG